MPDLILNFAPEYWHLPRDTTLGFVPIPAGSFWMGRDDGYAAERPRHRVELPDFWLGRYPVTVAQFRAYALAVGAEQLDPRALQDPDDHPVRYVTWYDALDYCRWLGERLRELAPISAERAEAGSPERAFWQGLAEGRLEAGLPSEAEWEKAARGPADARGYPWGADFDPARVNSEYSGLGTTTPVGSYPAGASPYGLLDLSGNLREWTRSLGDWAYPYDPRDPAREALDAPAGRVRVLRGGSFLFGQVSARCDFREMDGPRNADFYTGFRVAVTLKQGGE